VSWGEVFLGIIALATLTNAAVQVGVLLVVARQARSLQRLGSHIERELQPVLGHLNAMGRELSRAAALVAKQVDRADVLIGDLTRQGERALGAIGSSMTTPAREGVAVLRGFKAAIEALRSRRPSRRGSRGEDEDALFI